MKAKDALAACHPRNIPEAVKARICATSAHWEHRGYVAIAAVDLFHIERAVAAISLLLLLTGLMLEALKREF